MAQFEEVETAEAVEERKKETIVAVTDLSAYMYCPRRFYQQKVLGYEEKLNAAMILGAIRHKFYDAVNKHEEGIVAGLMPEMPREDVMAAYSKTYQNFLSHVVANHASPLAIFDLTPEEVVQRLKAVAVAEAHERAANVYMFASQHKIFGEELWQQLTPKIFTELTVKSLPLRLKGVVDRVEVYSNTVLPIELKTGKMAKDGIWPAHRVQVAAYMMLLQERFNTQVSQAVIRYLDFGSSRTVVFNPYMELEIRELTQKVARLLQSATAPKPCGRERCSCKLL